MCALQLVLAVASLRLAWVTARSLLCKGARISEGEGKQQTPEEKAAAAVAAAAVAEAEREEVASGLYGGLTRAAFEEQARRQSLGVNSALAAGSRSATLQMRAAAKVRAAARAQAAALAEMASAARSSFSMGRGSSGAFGSLGRSLSRSISRAFESPSGFRQRQLVSVKQHAVNKSHAEVLLFLKQAGLGAVLTERFVANGLTTRRKIVATDFTGPAGKRLGLSYTQVH